MAAPQEPAEISNHLTFGLPNSGVSWAAMLVSLGALFLGLATDGETLSRWVPGLLAALAAFMGLRAGIVRDERSLLMWIPLVLAGTYLFLLIVTSGF